MFNICCSIIIKTKYTPKSNKTKTVINLYIKQGDASPCLYNSSELY